MVANLGISFGSLPLLAETALSTGTNSGAIRTAEPTLEITYGASVWKFTRAELLKSPNVQPVEVISDPGYGGLPKRYMTAVPAAEIFKALDLPVAVVLKFVCLDNYSAVIDLRNILNGKPDGSEAFIAIETENEKWDPVKLGSPATAGPFYLIWKNSADVVIPEWPYQLAGFKVLENQ